MTIKVDILKEISERQRLCSEIKKMIVEQLSLDINPSWITDDQPLFGRGLELDSIDTLEIAVGLQDTFDVTMSDDNMEYLGSVNKIADYVEMMRLEDND